MSTPTLNLVSSLKDSSFKDHCNNFSVEVFKSLFEADITPDINSKAGKTNHEISAIISFMNKQVEAVVTLSCSRDTILELVKNNYGDSVNPNQTAFFLGEALNIIFGMLKEKLSFEGYHYEMCLPVVVSGQDHMVLNLLESEILVQNYLSKFGVISLTIGTSHKLLFSRVAS